jgi:lysophospholipid acyltransferase (LPLAT)-like uncharacterized protein
MLKHLAKCYDQFHVGIGILCRIIINAIFKRCTITFSISDEFEKIAAEESCIVVIWHHHMLIAEAFISQFSFKSTVLSDSRGFGSIGSSLFSYSKAIYVSPNPQKSHKGLLELIKYLKKEKSVCYLTPDGPSGPSRVAKHGVIALAKKARCKIFPSSYSASHQLLLPATLIKWKIPGWEKMILPRLGAQIHVILGDPIDVSTMSYEEAQKVLESSLNDLEILAQTYQGNFSCSNQKSQTNPTKRD